MSSDVLFENYVGAYRLRISSTNKKIYIYDYSNNFRCRFYKTKIIGFIEKLMKCSDINSSEHPFSFCGDGYSVYTPALHIEGYDGNWVKTDRIKPIIEKLAEVCSDVIEKYKQKADKPKTKKQLKRMKLATLISLARNIDNEKMLQSTITI